MLEGQPLLSVHHSLLVYQKSGNEFQLGYFDRFVHGHGEICSRSGLRYIFGPESVDLGPCCDPCDEDWIRILKNEDALFFSEGYTHSCGNEFVRTAKQVTIPGTYNDSGFLGVVLRERHPSSTEGATAAFLCPPFGIIKLHKFCFGCDPNVSWPPVVGARFWVLLNKGGGSARVQKVNGRADGDKFGHGSTKALINIPKLHLWQWNKTFNQSGIFEITDFILKNTVEARSVSTEIVRRKWQDKSSASASRGIQEYEEEETSAAISFLDPNEDPATGLERVASFTNGNAEARRRYREQVERDLEESRWRKSDTNKEKEDAVSSLYESLNYEIVENKLYQAEEMEPGHQWKLFRQAVNRWVVCFFIGVFTASVAAAVDIVIYYSSLVKFRLIISSLLNLCEKRMEIGGGCIWMVELAWICYNCVIITIAACLVLFLSPVAAGSGISQVKCFLNGVEIPGVVRLKTLFAKAFGVACTVAGGLSAGKEGPMIHSGAVVAAGISQGKCVTFSLDFHIFEQFRNDREKRDFVSAGAAAGVAAAFGAPIGGVLFSLEEGASFWNQSLTWRMFFAAMMSSFTLNFILSIFHGVGGFLSWNGLANFGVFEDHSYNIWEIPIFLLIGVLGGLSGALFNFLNLKLSRFRKKYIQSKCQKLMECLLVAAASAFTGFITLFLVNDCQPVGRNPKLTEVTKLWCRKGQYSAVANLFFQNPEESVKSLFHSPANSYGASTLLIFAVEYYFLSLWTYGLSVPSGIFIPTLLTGAAWGRLVGVMVEYMFPDVTGIHPGKYALAGAAAQLGGVVRMTISLTAILVEATRDITFGLPIMLVLMITKWVGDLFNEGLYDGHIELNEIPILGWCAPELSRNIFAGRIMRKDVVTMMPKEQVSHVIEVLRSTSHHGFPVIDEINSPSSEEQIPDYGHLEGLILKSQLITLIQKRVFYKDPECQILVDGSESVQLSDFADEYDECLAKLQLSEEERTCWLNLTPYMNPSPHRVPLSASLPSIFHLFRGLGLRHLRGIITRKDLARFKERRTFGNYAVWELFVSDFQI
uniref:Chloride channel protein n=1 Tax=Setaria digitata TaxID=48799 RepID=A0A915PKT8_9BILA